jgi:small subunit ribosomal protein S3
MRNEPEPRRQPLRDRRERRPGSAFAPPTPEPSGPVVQAPPDSGAAPRVAPILPPLAPPQPSWKQETKETPAESNGGPGTEPPKQG